jgi:hypothetical protein
VPHRTVRTALGWDVLTDVVPVGPERSHPMPLPAPLLKRRATPPATTLTGWMIRQAAARPELRAGPATVRSARPATRMQARGLRAGRYGRVRAWVQPAEPVLVA